MNKQPLISVIIPTYNRENIITRAIDSVIHQTYKNWELIIVDDGSKDKTEEVIKPYLKNHKISYHYQKNKGVCEARNYGIKKAKGEYIAFLDSDDEFEENKLSVQLCEMKKHNINSSLSNCYRIYEEKNKKKVNFKKSFIITNVDVISLRVPLSASLMMFKSKIPKEILFDPKLPTSNDFDFLLRILNKYKILFIKTPLVNIYKTLDRNRISTKRNPP